MGRSSRTFDNYSRHVAALALHFGTFPTELDPEQIKDYLFELQQRSKTPSQSYFKRHYGILTSSWKCGKLQALQSDLKIRVTEAKPKTLLNKCRCCREGNLVTIALFAQRGPPQEYLFVTQPLSSN